MSTKKLITSSVIAVALILAVVSTGCGAVESAQELYGTGNAFMTALKEGNYEQAYALFIPELQQEVGDVVNLQTMIEDNQAQPAEWSFTSFNFTTGEDQTQTATLEGNVTYQDGRQGGISLELVKVGEAWMLTSFNLTW